jgi:hypothetical protein
MKKTIKWDVRVIEAKEVINRLLSQVKREIRHERIQELLRGKGLIERFKMLIK